MKLILLFSHRFYRDKDGTIFSTQNYNYSLFAERYLQVFDHMQILARVSDAGNIERNGRNAEGPGVQVVPMGSWQGPAQYLRQRGDALQILRKHICSNCAVIMIVPGVIGETSAGHLQKWRQPYAVEVVGDPYDTFSPGAVRHLLRPFFQWWFVRQLKSLCKGAIAASYVTEFALQRRYPPTPEAFTTHYSSIKLPASAFVKAAQSRREFGNPIRLVLVGTLAQMYKAPDVLIAAVGKCVRDGLDLHLTIVGDGKHRSELEELVTADDLADHVCFAGHLPAGDAVRAELDKADLFILPSRQEGLPRAMIEAMARALPCIGSTVGGIPELLPPEDMVPTNNAETLARKICEIVTDPERMSVMSARNLAKVQKYREDVLRKRRIALYQYVKDKTTEWQQNNR